MDIVCDVTEEGDYIQMEYGCSVNGPNAFACKECLIKARTASACACIHEFTGITCCVPMVFTLCFNSKNHSNIVDMMTVHAANQLLPKSKGSLRLETHGESTLVIFEQKNIK